MYEQGFGIAYLTFVHRNQFIWVYGLGTSPIEGGGNVRVLLTLTRLHARELFGAAKASLRLALGTSL